MDFLKDVLGEDLFGQVQEKINAHNGDEANKDNQIKIGNLGSGQYVSKEKFNSKDAELSAKIQELLEANNLIGDLKKGTKNNEELQKKITDYDLQIAQLQAQVQEAKLKAAIKVNLMSEKALDVDYLTFKLNEKLAEKGQTLELDESGENIKGWKDMVEGLKIQFPTQFESNGNDKKILGDNRLPEGDKGNAGITQEQFNKMGYQSRLKLKQEQPETYSQLSGQ